MTEAPTDPRHRLSNRTRRGLPILALAAVVAALTPSSGPAAKSPPVAKPGTGDSAKPAAKTLKVEPGAKPAGTKPAQTAAADAPSTVSELLKASDAKPSDAAPPAGAARTLVVTIAGDLRERGDNVSLLSGPSTTKSLKGYLDMLRKVRDDKSVREVVFRFSSSGIGVATAQELRDAIAALRAKGKVTLAVLDDDSQATYLAATACETVAMPPSGEINLFGVRADQYYVKGLLDKVGVRVDVIHMGQYKSYGETLTQDGPSSAARANMTEIVDDAFKQYVEQVAASRKLTPAAVTKLLDAGPTHAAAAKAAGLIDRVAYADDILAERAKQGAVVTMADYGKGEKSDKSDDIGILTILSKMNKAQSATREREGKHPQVAVLYAVGGIEQGTGGGGFNQDDGIYSDDFLATLDEIKDDAKIKAVVLRVNSPGGSAFASDLMWKRIQELRRKKPVVTSMGEVAASGGYYMAMGTDRIVAQPGTITGSIGVVGGKPDVSKAYGLLGVKKETVSRGKYSGLFSETDGFDADQRQLVERQMKRTYDDFVGKAAQGRKLSVARVDELAQGRVWTGARAMEVGLVDELGGLDTAVLAAKKLVGLKPEDKVSLVTFPKSQGLFDMLSKAMGGDSATVGASVAMPADIRVAWTSLPPALRGSLKQAMSIGRMLRTERVLAISPALPVLR